MSGAIRDVLAGPAGVPAGVSEGSGLRGVSVMSVKPGSKVVHSGPQISPFVWLMMPPHSDSTRSVL